MTSTDRFERALPELLSGLVVTPAPEDLTDILTQTAALRQRPPWSFPERWFPMTAFAARTASAPRVPWRLVLFAVLAAVVLLGALLVAASAHRTPKLFGPATNGLVVFSHAGDIYTVDPATGATRAVVTGPDWDSEPRWSRDGTRFLYRRSESASPQSKASLYVATADGSTLTRITPEPIALTDAEIAPDGRTVMISTRDVWPPYAIASADGTTPLQPIADGPATPNSVIFRPPVGSQIAFLSSGGTALYLANADGTNARSILEKPGEIGYPAFSPDGSRLAFAWWTGTASGLDARVEVLDLATGVSRPLPMGPGAVWESVPVWSNDGSRLAIIRGYTGGLENVVAAIVPVDAGGKGIETDPSVVVNDGCCLGTRGFEWAPDDTFVLVAPIDATTANVQQTLIDARTGSAKQTVWATTSNPSIQRVAP